MNPFKKNCCDGVYNSFDVHFTSVCDNKCAHCIDTHFTGTGIAAPNVPAIVNTILESRTGYDDVLFLGGEPCLYLAHLVTCIEEIKSRSGLKVYVTTAVPKICYDKSLIFMRLLSLVDGINLSVQHHDEKVADAIRGTTSLYDRQAFYAGLPFKEKIRINLNIVKPYLYTREDILACLQHYDKMGFNEIKLSEIQHGTDKFVSFEKVMGSLVGGADLGGIGLGSPYYSGCQTHVDVPGIKTPVLLKRSCFMCEDTLKASFMDGVKVLYQYLTPRADNKYAVVYENGKLSKGWM